MFLDVIYVKKNVNIVNNRHNITKIIVELISAYLYDTNLYDRNPFGSIRLFLQFLGIELQSFL